MWSKVCTTNPLIMIPQLPTTIQPMGSPHLLSVWFLCLCYRNTDLQKEEVKCLLEEKQHGQQKLHFGLFERLPFASNFGMVDPQTCFGRLKIIYMHHICEKNKHKNNCHQ